jgi:hypothetical protein
LLLRPEAAAKFLDQQAGTDQKHPEWKSHENPRKIGAAEQKKRCESEAEVRHPARRDSRVDDDGRRRHHEHARHLDHVNIHNVIGQRASEVERPCTHHVFRIGSEGENDRADNGCQNEEHCQEKQTASQKHRCKKAILKLAEPIA